MEVGGAKFKLKAIQEVTIKKENKLKCLDGKMYQ